MEGNNRRELSRRLRNLAQKKRQEQEERQENQEAEEIQQENQEANEIQQENVAEAMEIEFDHPTDITLPMINYIEQFQRGKRSNKERDKLLNFANCKDRKIHQKAVKGHTGCVNAMALGKDETLLASAGDDKNVFVWKISDMLLKEQPRPARIMNGTHFSNVFTTCFTGSGDRLISTGNDSLILAHDVETGETITRYNVRHFPINGAIYSATFVPDDENVFVICSEDHYVEVYDIRVPREKIHGWFFQPENYSIDFHPNGRFFALGGKRNLCVIDFRNGKDIYNNELTKFIFGCGTTHAKWSPDGSGIAVVRSCSIPCYLDLTNQTVTYLTDKEYSTYITRNTVKSCDFVDNNTIITGSESFEIFMWHLDEARPGNTMELTRDVRYFEPDNVDENWTVKMAMPYIKLKGHRSIPNGIKYSPKNGTLFSCGVEKTIRTWSVYPFVGSTTNPPLRKYSERNPERINGRLATRSANPESEDDEVLAHFDRFVRYSRREYTPTDDEIEEEDEEYDEEAAERERLQGPMDGPPDEDNRDPQQVAFDPELDLESDTSSENSDNMVLQPNDEFDYVVISEAVRRDVIDLLRNMPDP